MLSLPRAAPLVEFVQGLRSRPGSVVPEFDPADGGTSAQALFLLEKPGPATASWTGGYGFVSRDNDTPTAEAIHHFMAEAGIPRERTALWNLVPWWNGTCAIRAAERTDGVQALAALLPLLPSLRAVVLVGRTAGTARAVLERTGLRLFASAHPSPQVRAGWPERWRAIPLEWRQVRSVLD